MSNGLEVGKECVSLRDGILKATVDSIKKIPSQKIFKRNTIFKVNVLSACQCGIIHIDVGLGPLYNYGTGNVALHCNCGIRLKTDVLLWEAEYFAPLQYDEGAIEELFSEIIKEVY